MSARSSIKAWFGRHRYLSTGCRHGDHAYCQGKEGLADAKRPAECKFCAAPCRCRCHQGGRSEA